MKKITRTAHTVMLVPETDADREELRRHYPRHRQIGMHGIVTVQHVDEETVEVDACERRACIMAGIRLDAA